jgi:hypothetical protein
MMTTKPFSSVVMVTPGGAAGISVEGMITNPQISSIKLQGSSNIQAPVEVAVAIGKGRI